MISKIGIDYESSQRLVRPISCLLLTSMIISQVVQHLLTGYGMEDRFASHMPSYCTVGTACGGESRLSHDTKYHENYPFMRFFKITVPNVVGYLKERKLALRNKEKDKRNMHFSLRILIPNYVSCRPTDTVVSDADCGPGEDMDVCKCIVPLRYGGTLNSLRAASSLVWLVEGEESREASGYPQGFFPLNWGGTMQNRTVTCMVLKAKANDGRKISCP
ncbi:uncharacterized protein TNCV_1030421 [Trichonephila clavipes]|nr:uncharacterized protein TNCV_1030421 [Trichonephila clavipes]